MAKLLRISEVAALLAVRRERVYELIRQGTLPAVRIGRQVRVAEGVLGDWVASGGRALPGRWRRTPDASVESDQGGA